MNQIFKMAKLKITQSKLINLTFNTSSIFRIRVIVQAYCDDRRTNFFGSIDNFFDSRYSQSDIHRSYTSKVKCFKRHLSSWFTYKGKKKKFSLTPKSTNRCRSKYNYNAYFSAPAMQCPLAKKYKFCKHILK